MRHTFLKKFILPRTKSEDIARREFILNILLVASISLVLAGFFIQIALVIFSPLSPDRYINNSLSPLIVFLILMFFISLYVLSRKGFFRLASYFLLGVFFLLATYMAYRWGVDGHAALLFYVLIIVMSGVLIGTRFAFATLIVSALAMLIIGYFQINNVFHPNLYWKNENLRMPDIFMFLIVFAIIATVSWLSNREIEKSLKRARRSEAELKKERDSLEVKVEERTAELKKAQMEQVSQMYRFAEFGKLSSGLFHDLVNPLTAASLNMEQINDEHSLEIKKVKSHFDKVAMSVKRMENFIIAVRKQMTKQKTESFFSLAEEIHLVIQILEYKAKKANVTIKFLPSKKTVIYGDPTKFSQIAANLVMNAIDSYVKVSDPNRERKVEIKLFHKDNLINLSVQDWGCGIASKFMDKIFQPFFTTKGSDVGTGIGLSLTRSIVENDFGGNIKCKSKKNKGTIFTVTFPIINK